MRKVFINNKTLTIIICLEKNYPEYENNNNFTFLYEGYKKDCIIAIEEYWEENYVPDEQRMYLQD